MSGEPINGTVVVSVGRAADQEPRMSGVEHRTAPLCVFCCEHPVGHTLAYDGVIFDEWCGTCEPRQLTPELYAARVLERRRQLRLDT